MGHNKAHVDMWKKRRRISIPPPPPAPVIAPVAINFLALASGQRSLGQLLIRNGTAGHSLASRARQPLRDVMR